MIIKRYLVKDMNEAMIRIRYELGSDAIIVSNRWVRQKGVKNLFRKRVLEVTAAVDQKKSEENMDTKEDQQEEKEKNPIQEEVNELKKMLFQFIEESKKSKEDNAAKESNEMKATKEPIQGKETEERHKKTNSNKIKDKNKNIRPRPEYIEQPLQQRNMSIEDIFEEMEIDDKIIEGFAIYCRDNNIYSNINQDILYQYLESVVTESVLPYSEEDIEEKIWVLIGPTGVGKTTTIAKIAAREVIENGKQVGLITLDTYRIGAVEQLKTYANILDIPIEIVISPSDLSQAIEKLEYCDLILIDSTGRSSLNQEQLSETKTLLDEIEEKRNVLVVSATTRSKDLKAIIQNYKVVGYEYLIVTKMDETQCYGNLLNIRGYTDKPLWYITTGQSVPDDIKVATKENVSYYVFGQVEI